MNILVRLYIAVAMLSSVSLHAANLQTLWTAPIAGPTGASHTVQKVSFDADRNIIVAGTVSETATGTDLLVLKLNGFTGATMWTFRKNSVTNGADKLGGIALAPNGDVFLAGSLEEEPGAGVLLNNAYLARLSGVTGLPVWELPAAAALPGSDSWHDIAVGPDGNPVVTGALMTANFGSDARTAKYDAASGAVVWEQTYRSFDATMDDQGLRIFVGGDGNVFVQGRHGPGNVAGVDRPPTIQAISYTGSGALRWGTRFREGNQVNAFGFGPAPGDGFIIGFTELFPQGNFTIVSLGLGNADGTFATERAQSYLSGAPSMLFAPGGDVLTTGFQVPPAGGPAVIQAARVDPLTLTPNWVRQVDPPGVGPSVGFAHAPYRFGESVMAGIGPGATTNDVAIVAFDENGNPETPLFLDGGQGGTAVTDNFPGGTALASDAFGGLVVASTISQTGGQRDALVRRMRIYTPPEVTITEPGGDAPSLPANQPATIVASASDVDGDTLSVEFFANGVSIGTATSAPFQVTHTFTTPGVVTLDATVTDSTGQTRDNGAIFVTIFSTDPIVTTGTAARTGSAAGLFSGAVSSAPAGTRAFFRYFVVGQSTPVFESQAEDVTGDGSVFPVAIPFTIPVPHATYQYALIARTSDGQEFSGASQTFTVPNAPVLAQRDFFFAARGPVTGTPVGNDLDADPNEVLVYELGSTSELPGTVTTSGGNVVFKPSKGFPGEALLTYTADDKFGSTSTETIRFRTGVFYAGFYRGLSPVNGAHVGAVDVVVNAMGRATVVGYLDGIRFATRGTLSQQPGERVGFLATIRRRGEPDKSLLLSWDLNRNFSASLFGPDSTFYYLAEGRPSGGSPFSETKAYSLTGAHTFITGTAGGRVSGFAHLRIPADGPVIFRGKLGDGAPFVTATPMASDGTLPIYTPLLGRGTSFLMGQLLPTATNAASSLDGMIAVQGPKTGRNPLFASDYRDRVDFAGPLYVPPTGLAMNFTTDPRMASIQITGGGFSAGSVSLPIWVGAKGRLSGIIGIHRISVDAQTGEFTGAILPPGQRRTIPFSGILRPDGTGGRGIFRGTTAAGEVQVVPQ